MCAKTSNVGTRIYLDQYDLSGFLNTAQQEITQEVPTVTGLAATGPERVIGNYDHRHSHGGFFDGLASQIDAIIDALRTGADADHYLCHLFGAYVKGNVAYESIVSLSEKPIAGAVGGAVALNTSFEGRNRLSRGLVLYHETASGTANGTGYNQGATTLGQTYQAVVRVLSGTFTEIIVAIQESQNDGDPDAYATISGMTKTFSAANTPAVQRLTTTAATEAYKRLAITGFTGTSALILVTGGVVS